MTSTAIHITLFRSTTVIASPRSHWLARYFVAHLSPNANQSHPPLRKWNTNEIVTAIVAHTTSIVSRFFIRISKMAITQFHVVFNQHNVYWEEMIKHFYRNNIKCDNANNFYTHHDVRNNKKDTISTQMKRDFLTKGMQCAANFSSHFIWSIAEYCTGVFTRSVNSPVCRLPRVGGNNTAVSLLYKSAAVLFPEGKKDVLYVFFSIRCA